MDTTSGVWPASGTGPTSGPAHPTAGLTDSHPKEVLRL